MTLQRTFKFFGHHPDDIFCCKFGDECYEIYTSAELRNLDDEGKVSWVKLKENSNLVSPICCRHGVPLDYFDGDSNWFKEMYGSKLTIH